MSTASLTMWFLRLYRLAVKDMPVVGYEHLWLLQSHVTCMLSDECLNRIPGLLNVNVCLQRARRISTKWMPRQTKRRWSMADHKNPLVRSSWAENSETCCRNDTSVGWRSGEAGTSTSSSKIQRVKRDGDVTRRLGACVLVSVSWLAYWQPAGFIPDWQTLWYVHVHFGTPLTNCLHTYIG